MRRRYLIWPSQSKQHDLGISDVVTSHCDRPQTVQSVGLGRLFGCGETWRGRRKSFGSPASPTHDKTTRRRRLSGGGTLASHLVGRAEDWPRGQQPSATKGAQTNCKKIKNQIFDGLFKSFQNGINFSFIVFWGQCPLRVDGVPHLRNTTIVVFLI